MTRHGRQTFKKRQREMARDQKREDKARRLAARRDPGSATAEPKALPPAVDEQGKPVLRVLPVRRGREGEDR